MEEIWPRIPRRLENNGGEGSSYSVYREFIFNISAVLII